MLVAVRKFLPTLISNATTSLVNLFVTVVVGRQEGIFNLGLFGVGIAVLGLTQLVGRETGINVAWANKLKSSDPSVTFTRTGITAAAGSCLLLLAAVILNSAMLGLIGVVLVGFCMYDFVRLWEISRGFTAKVLVMDLTLGTAIALVGFAVLWFNLSSIWLLGTWALLYPILIFVLTNKWERKLNMSGLWDRDGWSFGLQALIGSGSVHVSTLLLAALVSPILVGELRAATTVFGLVNIVTITMQSVVINLLAGVNERKGLLLRLMWTVLAVQGVLATATLMGGVFLGPVVFGSSWGNSSQLLPWLAVDAMLVAGGTIAIAAHKVDRIAKNASLIALISGVLRVGLIPAMGLIGESLWVVIALCCVSMISMGMWWLSYSIYRRRRIEMTSTNG